MSRQAALPYDHSTCRKIEKGFVPELKAIQKVSSTFLVAAYTVPWLQNQAKETCRQNRHIQCLVYTGIKFWCLNAMLKKGRAGFLRPNVWCGVRSVWWGLEHTS